MIPAEVVVVDKVPVLGTGKIDIVGVAKFVKERMASGASAPAPEEAAQETAVA
jgi:acyl-[acyl-carrier-protein]-phospholipid O-acyltransferase/long-chain-fatty-acid--[acyl-carrier-protein] ligase